MRFPTYTLFLSAVLATVITVVLAPIWIALLRRRGIGQSVRVDGPQGHLLKAGTPTMGGVLMIVAAIATFFIMSPATALSAPVLVVFVGCALIGLIDDLSKVLKERSLGLKARLKLALLGLVAVVATIMVANFSNLGFSVKLPIVGLSLPLGIVTSTFHVSGLTIVVPWLYLIFVYVLITATSNTVNLTDGLDGLAAGTVLIVMLAYAGIAFRQNNMDLAIFAASVAGACVGFLWYNSYPADIFMGDTGSLALGGAIAAMALVTKTELLLVLIGGIYVVEGLSVIIQVLFFRLTGKRVFKMAPIHHHFEMLGWSETKVMIRFWIVTAVFAGAGFALYFVSALREG